MSEEGFCFHYDKLSKELGLAPICHECRDFDRALENTIRELKGRLNVAEYRQQSNKEQRLARAKELIKK